MSCLLLQTPESQTLRQSLGCTSGGVLGSLDAVAVDECARQQLHVGHAAHRLQAPYPTLPCSTLPYPTLTQNPRTMCEDCRSMCAACCTRTKACSAPGMWGGYLDRWTRLRWTSARASSSMYVRYTAAGLRHISRVILGGGGGSGGCSFRKSYRGTSLMRSRGPLSGPRLGYRWACMLPCTSGTPLPACDTLFTINISTLEATQRHIFSQSLTDATSGRKHLNGSRLTESSICPWVASRVVSSTTRTPHPSCDSRHATWMFG